MSRQHQASHERQDNHAGSQKSLQGQAGPPRHGPTGADSGIVHRARGAPAAVSRSDVLHLQRVMGNRAVGSLLAAIGPGPRRDPPPGSPSEPTLRRRLILNGQERAQAADAQPDLGADFAALQATVLHLIDLPGPPVKVSTADLKEVDAFRINQTTPTSRAATVAAVQLLSHGTWKNTSTTGNPYLFTRNVLTHPKMAHIRNNLEHLGTFLRTNPNVVENLKAAGVGWELMSKHQYIGDFGGGAVIDERIHIQQWVLEEPTEGLMRMVVHEAGHATFQRMLITGENWTEKANTGEQPPDERALEADGRIFYEAWQVLRGKPQSFFITDMPGDSANATGAGRGAYLAGQFTEFCAESFMHLALKKAELQEHVSKLTDKDAAVKAAWQSALTILLKYENLILGRQAGAGKATLIGHRSNVQFMEVIQQLRASLKGPDLEVANIDEVRTHLATLRQAWRGLLPADQARHRGEALTILDDYIMRVQRRRPAQANLGSELGFTGL